ncbi:MAG: hypothetical protein VW806_12460, partial [Halieaceae bacterium]
MTYYVKWLITIFAALLWTSLALGQEADTEEEKESEKEKTIAELIDGHAEFTGLFTFYRDPESGKTALLL